MKNPRVLTYVQQRIAQVRAERRALLDRAAARFLRADDDADAERQRVVARVAARVERPLLRGETEPEVIVAEDGSVCLAPLEWSTEATDAGEQ